MTTDHTQTDNNTADVGKGAGMKERRKESSSTAVVEGHDKLLYTKEAKEVVKRIYSML